MRGFSKNIKIYILLFFVCILASFLRLFYIQIIKHDEYKYNNKYRAEIRAKRGSILTSDMLELAFDLEYQSFILDPTLFKDEEEINKFFDILHSVVPEVVKSEHISKFLKKRQEKSRYYPFEKVLITMEQRKKLDTLIREEKKKDKEVFKNKFIHYNSVFKRKYVDNEVFETLVGYLNKEGKGVYGVEHKYDEDLSGKNGIVTGTRPFSPSVAEYTLQYLIDQKVVEKEVPGNNLVLSINSIMQYSLDEVLKDAFEKYTPVSAMGIIMETDTGRIIAMDSYPKATNLSEVKNYNITSLFEPGSIFKPITVASAINEGKIDENTLISSNGFIKVRNRIIKDHDNSTLGNMTVSQIMAHSGNVGLVKISQMLEPEVFYSYLSKFGLGSRTGIDTSYESAYKLFNFKDFTDVRRSNVSFGQGINMTQLQILTALNTTINGGNLIQPRVVDRIIDNDGKLVKQIETVIKSKVITDETSAKMRSILEGVVSSGTGSALKLVGYRIGGKTGTAQKAGVHGYEYGKYFSSFFTFFPADKPKYSILITLDEPHGAYYGAAVALPVAREMVDKIIQADNILPNSEAIEETKENIQTPVENKTNNNKKIKDLEKALNINLMPNLIGLTRKNLLKLDLSKYNLKITGNGKVVSQSPEPGTVIKQGSKIILELK
ncbi:penicillin-binding protein [Pseudostreptobacillus hongkongensis]|uniref:penicillin-binding protein n=1 Tax=Pseudostreptobacillus hongkongensis TaxID=1162717 RepID=UPI0028D2D667|nr:penicillin-binding protein [Pseudostreptobacillus hongkongensis]